MVKKLVIFAVVAVLVYLLCIFVGGALILVNIPIASFVGMFLKQFAVAIGILVGLWYAVADSLPL